MRRFITGNSFPMSLIRRKVVIEPESFENYLYLLRTGSWESFWGHTNTLAAVNRICGTDLTPRFERPAIQLNELGYPSLFGETFYECWLLSPEYPTGFRPAIGAEVQPEQIQNWQVLRILWE